MKAIVQQRYGSPHDVLEFHDIDGPKIGGDEVLVRVHAAAVAIGDWLVANGLPYIARPQYGLRRPKSRVAGHEMAGTVEAVGAKVTDLQPGDEVFGQCAGAFAEYALASGDALAPKPANVTFEQAAAVPVSGLAALQALRDKGEVRAGQEVLVIGASGGVGTFTVQIAKALEAEVTGVCSTRSVDMVRSIGAHRVIDYTKEGIDRDGRRYDVIVDLAGNRSLSELRGVLAARGTLVLVGGSGGRWFMGFGRTIRSTLISPFVRQKLRALISSPRHEDLLFLSRLLESGKLTPVIDRTFQLSETVEAIDYMGQRHTQGKTIISV